MSKKVKRSELIVGRKYLINDTPCIGVFEGRQDTGIFFTIDQEHPFSTSCLSGRENQVGFSDSDVLKGFEEVKDEE